MHSILIGQDLPAFMSSQNRLMSNLPTQIPCQVKDQKIQALVVEIDWFLHISLWIQAVLCSWVGRDHCMYCVGRLYCIFARVPEVINFSTICISTVLLFVW